MSKLIPPSPGRVVWYYPSQQELEAKQIAIYDQGQPLAATVAYVFSDRLVNLSVVDQAGAQFRRTSVKLLQEDDERPHNSEGPYATWMPYQLGQAKLASDLKALENTALTVAGEAVAQAVAQGIDRSTVSQQGEQLQASAVQPVAVGIDPATPGADQTVETKVYTDGASATGTAPLPEQSPAQQDAGAAEGTGTSAETPAA